MTMPKNELSTLTKASTNFSLPEVSSAESSDADGRDATPESYLSYSMTGCTIGQARDIQSHNILHNTFNILGDYPQSLLMEDQYFANSRDEDLSVIMNWLETLPERLLWLRSAAATGKSTLLRHLLAVLREKKQLGTFYFFPAECSLDPLDVIKHLVREIAASHPEVTQSTQPLPSDATLQEHLMHFVLRPLQRVSDRNLLVVIDGIDQYAQSRHLLAALSRVNYPNNIKLLFSGRPTEELTAWHRSCSIIELVRVHDLGGINDEIMLHYLTQRLMERNDWRSKNGLPTTEKILLLARRAVGYIGWAAFAANLICDPKQADPDETLDEVVKSLGTLDALYAKVLEPLRHRSERNRKVLGMMLVIEEPLPPKTIDELTYAQGLSAKEVCNRLRVLQTHNGTAITPMAGNFHSSFLEFLRDPSRCDPVYLPISSTDANFLMFQSCSKVLEDHFPSHRLQAAAKMCDATAYSSDVWPFHAINTVDSPSIPFPEQTKNAVTIFISRVGKPWVYSWLKKCGLDYDDDDTMFKRCSGVECLRQFIWRVGTSQPLPIIRMLASVQEVLLQITCDEDPNREEDLNVLHILSNDLYERTYSPEFLSRGLCYWQAALKLRPWGDPQRGPILRLLGQAFYMLHRRCGASDYIDNAIECQLEASQLYTPGHPDRNDVLTNLGAAYGARYDREARIEDLNEAIKFCHESLRTADVSDRSMTLHNLGVSLHSWYLRQGGSVEELERATNFQRKALELCAPGNPNRSLVSSHLGWVIRARYDRQRNIDDLNEVIKLQRESLRLNIADHAHRCRVLDWLGDALCTRYHREGDVEDLDEGIRVYRQAVQIASSEDLYPRWIRSLYLDHLATALEVRFNSTGCTDDLNELTAVDTEIYRCGIEDVIRLILIRGSSYRT